MADSAAPDGGTEPDFEPSQKRALTAFWEIYEPMVPEIEDELEAVAREVPGAADILGEETEESRAARKARSRRLLQGAFEGGDWKPYIESIRSQGAGYAQAGMAFAAWFDLIRAFRQAILARVLSNDQPGTERKESEAAPFREVMEGMNLFVDLAMANIGEAYLETREGIIDRQRTAIRELSTPILQVYDQLLLLPVVGVVDTDRAKQLTEALLLAIQRHRARVIVIDITGVPIVDSKVANHLVQSIDAAELMGARVVVTGISPEIAQTMVTIGADLGRVRTLGSLRGGIEYAASILSLPIGGQRPGAGTGARDDGTNGQGEAAETAPSGAESPLPARRR